VVFSSGTSRADKSTNPQIRLRLLRRMTVLLYLTWQWRCYAHHVAPGDVVCCSMHVELIICSAHAQARGYAAPAPPAEDEDGKLPVTGATKRKAINLEGRFVPASLQGKYRRLLVRAVFEDCAGVTCPLWTLLP